MSPTFAIFLDLLVVGLLIATIIYAVSLNRSIAKLRDGKAELAVLLQNLAESVTHADVAISSMKSVAGEYDTSLSRQIGTARALVDELQVINETANNLASRIERAVQGGRSVVAGQPVPVPVKADPFAALMTDDEDEAPVSAKGRKGAGAPARGRSGADRELADAIDLLRRGA
jgi:hypothetical protein